MYLQWHFKLEASVCPDLSTQPPMVRDSLEDLSIIDNLTMTAPRQAQSQVSFIKL